MKKNGAAAVRRRLRCGVGARCCKPFAVAQNRSFNPNCICLPGLADCTNPNVPAVPVPPPVGPVAMTPLHDGAQEPCGAENTGVLVKLINWVMNCRLNRSVM